MPDAGDLQTVTLTVSPHDGTTVAALALIAPDGTTTAPTASTSDGGQTWTATVTYATAGVWTLRWTVTGTGAGVEQTQVTVGPTLPVGGRTYATSADYAAYMGTAAPAGVGLQLVRATRLVDQVLLSAIYDVDDDGLATDEDVAAALRDATIEQAAYWAQTGEDGTGALSEYANVSIGSVSLGRAQTEGAGPGSGARTLAPQAWQILTQAGLTGHAPRAC